MYILVKLPTQIRLGSNIIKCFGVQGTDTDVLACTTDVSTKTIKITNAVTYQKGNPGFISILFETLKNPEKNIVTASFELSTYTSNEYILDTMLAELTINFYCEYPCNSCDKVLKEKCYSCYGGDEYSIFYDYQCLDVCPDGFTNTELYVNNCTMCEEPCLTCSGSSTSCNTCMEGYRLTSDICVELVYWPFPWVVIGIV